MCRSKQKKDYQKQKMQVESTKRVAIKKPPQKTKCKRQTIKEVQADNCKKKKIKHARDNLKGSYYFHT